MQIIIAHDRLQLGSFVAEKAASVLRSGLERQDRVNLVVATGSSQFEVLNHLVQQPGIDWQRIHGFHLDEYLGIDHTHPASFCRYLQERFVGHVPMAAFHFLDGSLDPAALVQQANQALDGKRVDLLLCGIGENGHLAFNDPPADFDSAEPYRIVELDDACRKQQVGEGWFDNLESVPQKAISMTIRQILKAEVILCSVPDLRKAVAVKSSVEGPVTPLVPASVLQQHADTHLVLDTASSSLLTFETLRSCRHLS